jgi:BolA protein
MRAVVETMRTQLAALEPQRLDIRDDSAKHAGHAGSRAGGGHFAMTIVSPQFAGKPTMARHRMVYDALGALMKREIHALSIDAKTPEET